METEAVENPGELLRKAREAAHISEQEMAEHLNMSLRYVKALEANDRKMLPAVVFVRGYIRRYAQVLRLDPEPLLEAFGLEKALPSVQPIQEAINPRPMVNRHIAQIAAVILAVLALAAVALVLNWPGAKREAPPAADGFGEAPAEAAPLASPDGGVSEAAPPASPDGGFPEAAPPGTPDSIMDELAETSTSTPAEMPDGSAAEADADAEAEAGNGADAGVETNAGNDADADIEAGVSFDDAPGSADEIAYGPQRITPAGEEALWFEFSEDCWVEVQDVAGQVLYNDLHRQGDTLSLVGEGPFRILLGYAPGARLSYNGERVSLAPHSRNGVASLVLGQ